MSEFISTESPPSALTNNNRNRVEQDHRRNRRYVHGYEGHRGGRGGRGSRGGRGRGRGGRGQGRGRGDPSDTRTRVNGVDVSDPTRTYTSEEYSKLYDVNYIPTLKLRRRRAAGGDDGSNTVASLRSENEQLSARLAALEGVMNADESNQRTDDDSTISTKRTKASNGTNFGSGAYKKSKT